MMLLAIVAIVAVVLLITRKKKDGASCTPSDDEKTVAGGEGVLTFVHNESGKCVADTCVEGYTLGDGICSKAEEVEPEEEPKAPVAPVVPKAPTDQAGCLEEYDPSKTYPVIDGKADNYDNYCHHATREECKEAFCSSDKFKSKCANQCSA